MVQLIPPLPPFSRRKKTNKRPLRRVFHGGNHWPPPPTAATSRWIGDTWTAALLANFETLQHLAPGAMKTNGGSSQLVSAMGTHVSFIFRGYFTHNLGCKTFIFHGFGFQGWFHNHGEYINPLKTWGSGTPSLNGRSLFMAVINRGWS